MREVNPRRVVVAMSGGVDSSVAAALLHEQGFEVIGISLKLWNHGEGGSGGGGKGCCTPDDLRDARRVAERFGFPYYVFDLVEEFESSVVSDFVREYLIGRTPNPCVACNDTVKFSTLLKRSRLLGAEALATGHYARLIETEAGKRLLRGADAAKDQSYFLYNLSQEILAYLRFPVGHLGKDEVRREAHRLGVPVADKADSQDICFLPSGDHASFVAARAEAGALSGGRMVGPDGAVLGTHDGIHRFTVGQRKGLGIAVGERLYVTRIDANTGDVHLGKVADLESGGLRTGPCNWIAGVAPEAGSDVVVRIRHRHHGMAATVYPQSDGSCEVRFQDRLRAVAPGQAAVMYLGDEVLGGGTIRESLA